ncbi:universal stress protein [Streptomyces albiaxialis]|uniref:Universal stress protein n=1 Tax=Streptomyces albiaxialis TaxID=329523 RepID=A0ABP5HCX5_9ACTN
MTDTPGHVVVGYDGSAPAARAVDRAAAEAARRNTGLDVLCGWPWSPHAYPASGGPGLAMDAALDAVAHRDTAQAALDARAAHVRESHPGMPVTATLTEEAAAPALVRASRDAPLTVVGARGHGGFAGLLLGSVGLRVAAHCEGPLMVVRGDGREERAGERAGEGAGEAQDPAGTVLLGVKSDDDAPAVRFAFEEARRRAAKLSVLHAWLYPPIPRGTRTPPSEHDALDLEEYRRTAEQVARSAFGPLREEYADVMVDTGAACADPAPVLLEASGSADVVVLAAHRPRHRLSLQLGPVTHALLHHAHCPVVLVPVGSAEDR